MSLKKIKVLIVEDEEIDSESMSRSFEEQGFAVKTVSKGAQEEAALRGFDGLLIKRVKKGNRLREEKKQREGCLELDPAHYEIKKNGKEIQLTLREFKLLNYLMKGRGRIFSREELLSDVWGYEYIGDIRTVDVMIRRLREKLEDVPSRPRYIKTKRSVGYYFDMSACR